MATNLYPPPRPLSVGEILDLSFRIFRATLVTCLLYAAVLVVADQLPNIYNLASRRPLISPFEQRDPVFWLFYLAGVLIAALLWGAIVLRQHAVISGGAVSTAAELGSALRRLPGLVLTGILIVLAMGVWFIPLVAFLGAGVVTLALAGLVLSIPATWVAVQLSVAAIVLLLTGRGAVASLTHSWRLVWGSWWRLAAVYTVGLVLLIVLYTLAGVIAVAVAVPLARGDLAVTTAVSTVIVVILSAIAAPYYTALLLAVYGDLSVRREGADLAQRIAGG
jgi:hypothetical protein